MLFDLAMGVNSTSNRDRAHHTTYLRIGGIGLCKRGLGGCVHALGREHELVFVTHAKQQRGDHRRDSHRHRPHDAHRRCNPSHPSIKC